MCDPSLPDPSLHKNKIKAVYSYGIAREDHWGAQLAEYYNVPLHRYDCFADPNSLKDQNRTPIDVSYHQECVVGTDNIQVNGWKRFERNASTFEMQLIMNGHSDDQIGEGELIGKMDIEGSEWNVLANARLEDLRKFQQFTGEYHLLGIGSQVDSLSLRIRQQAFRRLREAGFSIVHIHGNNLGSGRDICLEITWARVEAPNAVAKRLEKCRVPRNHELDVPINQTGQEVNITKWLTQPIIALHDHRSHQFYSSNSGQYVEDKKIHVTEQLLNAWKIFYQNPVKQYTAWFYADWE